MSDVELTISAGRKEPSSLRLVATLALAGTLSGLVLASVHQITEPVILANQAEELEEAIEMVVPGYERATGTRQLLVVANEEGEKTVYVARDEGGTFLGYAIEHEGPGFQDVIRLLYGYDPVRRRVTGMQILESQETPGLGDRIYKDADFVDVFRDLGVEPSIKLVKGEREAENEVDAITGATISSKAVVKIINNAHARWGSQLPEAPPAEDPGPEEPN